MKSQWLVCLTLALAACPSVTVDDNEGALGPTVEFDPANKIIPFPNNLLLDPASGKLNLPEQCNESPASTATRVGTLNKLDGFGTYETSINVTFTEAVDVASLEGRVLLFKRAASGEGTDPLTAISVPVVPIVGQTRRFTNQTDIKACTDPVLVDQVRFIPTLPLDQKSTYTVALLSGIKTASGAEFGPAFTWSLVREPSPVVLFDDAGNVTLNRTPLESSSAEGKASLIGIDLLWNAHHDLLSFLAGTGHDSDEILLAFEFNTQTVSDPLDPEVEGSLATMPTPLPFVGLSNPAAGAAVVNHLGPFAPCATDNPVPNDTQCFLRVLLGGGNPTVAVNYAIGKATCAAAGCDNIGTILTGATLSKQYLTDRDNTLYTGTGTQPIPGPWTDPVNATVVHDTDISGTLATQVKLETLVLLPVAAAPATGYPTVVFQHGITRSKGDVFAMAGSLTGQQYAVVAIDAALHGSRAVRISNAANANPKLDCSNVVNQPLGPRPDLGPDPTAHTNCYAPIFSSDLAATRDGFRQSILDLQQVITSLQACGLTNCGALDVDVDQIFYVGQSLGGIYGTILAAVDDRIKSSVLDVPGVGWIDILENTRQTLAFQCPLVDALIDAGFLTGDKFDPTMPGVGLCLTDAWKSDPGYLQFAVIGRWVLDPADPANYASRLADRNFLLQRVDNDEVIPNIATDNEGELAFQLRGDASCGQIIGSSVPPSTALLAAPGQTAFLNYVTVPPGTAGCAVGNTFTHGSLLAPTGRCATTTSTICNVRGVVGDNGCPNNEVCNSAADGTFGTVRMQTDAIFFLLSNTED